MPPRSSYPAYDRLLGGKLGETLAKARADGLTYNQIALRLRYEHLIEVSGETVRRWMHQPQDAA